MRRSASSHDPLTLAGFLAAAFAIVGVVAAAFRLSDGGRGVLGAAWFLGLVVSLAAATLVALAVIYAAVRRRRAHDDALLASEQRFHLLTQSVLDYAIYMLDPAGNVASWNAGAERIKGWRADEIVGQHFSVFFPPEDVAAGRPWALLDAASSGSGHFEEEAWRVRKDGTRFWAGVAIAPVRDAAGGLLGYAKVTRDLSERKLAEDAMRGEVEERRRAERALQELNASLERLVSERTAELSTANEDLLRAHALLQEVSARLISAQEEERRRIARELHDETGQALAAIRLRLVNMAAGGDRAGSLHECLAIVDEAVAQIRNLAVNLRPPMLDDLGLADATEWMLERQAKSAGWNARLEAIGLPERLPAEIETASFRICQEALTNVARHAGAKHVRVALRMAGRVLELTVADDGAGFEPGVFASAEERRKHFGLLSMAERAKLAGGRIEVESTPGSGTRVRALLPLDALAHPVQAGTASSRAASVPAATI